MHRSRYQSFALFILFAALACWQPAQARIVGIVFDDSGSMTEKGTVHLPSFGAQFIISTLDGRAGNDRLLTVKLNANRPENAGIATQNAHQDQIDRIRRNWPRANGQETSLRNVAEMVRQVIAQQKDGEEAFIVVITDGGFNAGYSSPPAWEALVRQAASGAKGPVRSDFILINAQGDPALTQLVRAQGVARGLASVFNGDPSGQFYDVNSFNDMFDAVQEITARISGTDDVTTASANVQKSDTTITVKSPFSIARLVAVTSAEDGRSPPEVVSTSFNPTERLALNSSMARPDDAAGWNRRMSGRTEHFRFTPALPSGTHTLEFSGSVGRNSFLVYETEALIELSLVDENGNAVPQASDGSFEISVDTDYQVEARVFSDSAGQNPVDFSDLDNAGRFTALITDPALAKTSLPLERFDAENLARGTLNVNELGEFGLQGILRLPGFVSPTSDTLRLRVVNNAAELSARFAPLNPASDGAAQFPVTRTDPPELQHIAEITVADASGVAQAYLAELAGGSPVLSLTDATKQIIDKSTPVPMGTPVFLTANANEITSGASLKDWPARLLLAAAPPARGKIELDVVARPVIDTPALTVAGHSKDPTGSTGMNVDVDELETNSDPDTGGGLAFDFTIRDTLAPPEAEENVTVVSNAPWGLSLDLEIVNHQATVTPRISWWCACVLYWQQGEVAIAIGYDDGTGLQSAVSEHQTLILDVSLRDMLISCGKILLLVATILYLIVALIKLIGAERFPRQSVMVVDETLDKGKPTRKMNLRSRYLSLYPKSLVWWAFKTLDEQFEREGLFLTARKGGAFLDLEQSKLQYEHEGENLDELVQDSPNLKRQTVSWHDEFKRRDGTGIVITLYRSIADVG